MTKIDSAILKTKDFFIICAAGVFMLAWFAIETKHWIGRYIISPIVDVYAEIYIRIKKIK